MYSYDKVVKFVHEEDVKFIRLAFFDVFGVQKNISIMPGELLRAFTDGISFDASAVAGFGDEVKSDLFLYPDPETLSILPWRPANGRVARMYCDIRYPDGTLFEKDSRLILKNAVKYAKDRGITVNFGSEVESTICSERTKKVIRQNSPLIMRATWILPLKTEEKTCVGRFVLR